MLEPPALTPPPPSAPSRLEGISGQGFEELDLVGTGPLLEVGRDIIVYEELVATEISVKSGQMREFVCDLLWAALPT